METIRDLEALLLPADEPYMFAEEGGLRIVVLKQFRFQRALCIELYDAATTQSGKIKNPLVQISAHDAALSTKNPDALLFIQASAVFNTTLLQAKLPQI